MDQLTNKIYARLDGEIVIKLFSSVFEQPEKGDVLVDEGVEEYHAHVHLKYLVMDDQCRYNYKVINGELIELTEKEKDTLFPPVVVEEVEPLEDQVKTLKDQLSMLEQDMADLLLTII